MALVLKNSSKQCVYQKLIDKLRTADNYLRFNFTEDIGVGSLGSNCERPKSLLDKRLDSGRQEFEQVAAEQYAESRHVFSCIQRFLTHLDILPRFDVILVTPTWEARPWFTTLTRLAKEGPIFLGELHTSPMIQTIGEQTFLADDSRYRLAAWKLSKP